MTTSPNWSIAADGEPIARVPVVPRGRPCTSRRSGRRRLVAGLLVGLLVSSSPAAAQPCIGDCNGDQLVTVNELIQAVNIALGTLSPDACRGFSFGGAQISIGEAIADWLRRRVLENTTQNLPVL